MKITSYNGFNPKGDNITILAGVHGNELTPVYTLMKIVRDSSFSDLSIFNNINKLTIVNGINSEGLNQNKRNFDKTPTNDLNRSFRYDDIDIVKDLKTILDSTTILLDIHSSPNCTEFALIDYNEDANFLIDLCNSANVTYGVRYSNGNTLKKYISDKGGMSLTIEIDGMEKINYSVIDNSIALIKNILNNLFNESPYKSEPMGLQLREVFVYTSGLIEYLISPGDLVVRGDIICNVLAFDGSLLQQVKTDTSGIVILVGRDFAQIAESVCIIQNIETWNKKQ